MSPITPHEFITKWRAAELKERSAAQEHFIDLCRLLGEPTPAEADSKGQTYCFERGARKDTGGDGWADVWKRHHFAWEYKGRKANLDAAFDQLRQYALALENPPLLIVSDMQRIRIRTNWTNCVSKTLEFSLDDLANAARRAQLKWAFSDPGQLRPGETRQSLTEKAAASFAELAQTLRERGHDPQAVAHFINRLIFCMFADDVGLLPNQMFRRMLEAARRRPEDFVALASELFRGMASGGRIGFEPVDWFNGGLFDDDKALALNKADIDTVLAAAHLDWSEIDPSILGTLFERGLDPGKRAQLGAHYTDREKIMLIIEPVVIRPWLAAWASEQAGIATDLEGAKAAKSPATRTKRNKAAEQRYRRFLDRLRAFTVLDPACGSGNFLYLALQGLKDLEQRIQVEAESLGFQRAFPEVGPANVKGLEINPYAAELARVSIWIGEIQWMRRNGFAEAHDPILKPLDTIECRDAILAAANTAPEWPDVDVIIGNPPFLGDKRLIGKLGEDYVSRLRSTYANRVPAGADLVCYWFQKASQRIDEGAVIRAGLVATNSIRGGKNRTVLDQITRRGAIFDAWADEPWVVDGAAVRVSLVCFSKADYGDTGCRLDGEPAKEIHADLTARRRSTSADVTAARRLAVNSDTAFLGVCRNGPFDVPGDRARDWLRLPANPNGRSNADVLKPWVNGMDLTRRSSERWIIDFGFMTKSDAALYETPFEHVVEHVKSARRDNRVRQLRELWWCHQRSRPEMWSAVHGLSRYIATPTVAKHRLFAWLDTRICPDHQLVVIAREDDTTFGILHSRFHEVWSLRLGTWLGKGNDPRYTPTTTFETFPFPPGLTPDIPPHKYAANPCAIAVAKEARRLVELRDRWLNPSEWVEWVDEPVPGYPQRPVPRNEAAAKALKDRTLTKLYNTRPQWLADAHAALDGAVAAAYGWTEDISDDEVLSKLLKLNSNTEP